MQSRGTSSLPKVEYVVACSSKAEWALARRSGWGEVRESLDFVVRSKIPKDVVGNRLALLRSFWLRASTDSSAYQV